MRQNIKNQLVLSGKLLAAVVSTALLPFLQAFSTEGLWSLHAGVIIIGAAALLPMPTKKVLRENHSDLISSSCFCQNFGDEHSVPGW